MLSQKIAVVTGGGGFMGSHLVKRLVRDHFSVHVISKHTTNVHRLSSVMSDITVHTIGLERRVALKKTLQKISPSHIYHLAAHGSYPHQVDLDEMTEANIYGTLNLLVASQDIPYKAFIHTGSSSEYGFKSHAMKETDVLEPISFYAATKASATLLCQVFARQYRKPIVTLRPFSVYGPNEESTRFIPTIISRVLANTPIQITPKNERRDFIYIDDAIAAFVRAGEKALQLSGTIFNIGTGRQYTNDEVVQELFKAVHKSVPVEKGAYPPRTWDTPHWVADISLTKKFLGWKSKVSLSDGLVRTYNWMKLQKFNV
ncbi:NAD-dependent epimerase/dehydratase family protein [Candidatus Gottesmanbacteria bacterium]|nr:NAD-dependent epimerase/dehydratase family protein [Candidatus Gottesmanbacteria bacterium]